MLFFKMKSFFTETLLAWHHAHPRPMPWSSEKDPYRIWLSEMILQQTRVKQGTSYYLALTEAFPAIQDLANAPEEKILRLWQGLGYYRRVRQIHAAAKYIAFKLNGCFPTNYETLLQLEGVGNYTAAAIASFAFDLPHAVLDGNVYRVLSRFCGIETPIDDPNAPALFSKLAHRLLDKTQPAVYNQAIMNFGALQCVPKSPVCEACPLKTYCFAFQQEQVTYFPVSSKKTTKNTRFFNYLFVKAGENVWLHQRIEKDIWQNLYELPLIETPIDMETADALITYIQAHPKDWWAENLSIVASNLRKSAFEQQKFNYRHWRITFWVASAEKNFFSFKAPFFKMPFEQFHQLPFPKAIADYLQMEWEMHKR
ncbi:MAG: hypothetical protein RLZZ628_1952 [Bacteroidota bacterium]|jgi:A/G-specific adenine glycosylase